MTGVGRACVLFGITVFSTLVVLLPQGAEAMPMFARKYATACSTCHLAWPMLNATGRSFKENGYRFARTEEEGQIISDALRWEKQFPAGVLLVARPYDKRESGDEKLRALHEVEVFIAGQVYKNVSAFFEIEAEDETGFDPEVPLATFAYHHSDPLNLRFAWSGITFADPYDTFSGTRRLTRGSQSVIDKRFGGADAGGTLDDSRQNVFLSGRFMDRSLFYSLGISGSADDSEGENPNIFSGRVAFDLNPQATVGALAIFGKVEDASTSRDRHLSRYGLDAQVDFPVESGPLPGTIRLMGAYLQANDDQAVSGDLDNDAWYAQALYVASRDGRPTWVPLVRFDRHEVGDDDGHTEEITVNLTYYFTQNIKGYVEGLRQLDVPSGQEKDGRLTFQLFAAF